MNDLQTTNNSLADPDLDVEGNTKPHKDPDEQVIDPLVNWKNPPKITDLKQDLVDSKDSHDTHLSKISEWLDNLHVRGAAKIKPAKNSSSIVPKLIRKQAEWRYAPLSEPFLSTKDIFNVNPKTWEDKASAKQNEMLLNTQFNTRIDKVRFIDEYVRTGVDEGTVIVRVGWENVEEEYTETVPIFEYVINPEFAGTIQEIGQLKEQSPSQYLTDVPEELKIAFDMSMEQQAPIEPRMTNKSETVTKTRTLINRPTVEVCDYRNVVIDPTCMGDLDKAQFVIYTFESSRSALEKDGKYKNLHAINVETNSILNSPDNSTSEDTQSFNFSDEPRKKFFVHEYWGYWDIDGTGIVKPFVGAWVGDTMIRLEENPYPDKKIPFIMEQYLPVRKSNYGEPDGALLEDNQKVIGAITRGMIDVMGRSANGQTGMRKDMLDATNRRKFDQGKDYEFNQNVDPRQGVHSHVYPEIPNSAQFMLQQQNMEAESLTGVKAFSQTGISGASLGDVAVGVRGALDAASKRELGILRRLSNGIIKIGRKFISMNAEFLDDEEVIRITNEEFVTIRRDDLSGNFDLELSISTAEEDNNKAEQLAFMLQTVGPNTDPEIMKMILSDIATLRKMPSLAQKILEYQPQPDPLEVQKKQLEIELLKAQIQTEYSKSVENEAQAVLDQAKAGTEQVKQGNLASDTDKKDLDYVEQESGVTQERELEKQKAQAHGNMELEAQKRGYDLIDKDTELLKKYIDKAKA